VVDEAPLSNPQGVATDAGTGDLFVADAANNRIEKFSGSGDFLLAFGAAVGGVGKNVCLAIEAGLCQKGTSGSAPGEFTAATFLAVDNDPSSSSFHDVYVADVGDQIVSKFTSEGVLVESWGTKGQLNGSTTVAGSFGAIAGIAVGSDGILYVLNTSGLVFEFEPGSAFSKEVQLSKEAAPDGLGVNSAGELFAVTTTERIFVSEASGGFIGRPAPPELQFGAISVGPEGSVYFVKTDGSIGHYAFNGAGEVVEPGGGTCVFTGGEGCAPSDLASVGFVGSGIAAAASEDVFVANAGAGLVAEFGPSVTLPDVTTGEAGKVGKSSAVLHGVVKPDGVAVTGCEFEYVEAGKYNAAAKEPYAGGGIAACVPAAGSIATAGETEVSAEVAGLTPGVSYHFRLTAENANDEPGEAQVGLDAVFETQPPPAIDSATASGLTSSSAVLNAKITPEFSATHYHFEYVEQVLFEGSGFEHATRVPACLVGDAQECQEKDPELAASRSGVAVAASITGLSTETLYHWRVVASNESGTTTSVQHMFIYQAYAAGLPDGRAYEMVSPAHKNGAFLAVFEQIPRIAPDGERVMAEAIQCFDSSGSCTADRGGISANNPYSFTRTAAGWVAQSLAPPAAQFEVANVWSFNAASGDVLLSMPTPAGLGGNGEDDFYVREAAGIAHMGPVTPLAKGALGPVGGFSSDEKQAVTGDYSHFTWEAPEKVAFEAGTGTQTTYEYARPEGPEGSLLESGGAQPLLVGVSGGGGSTSLISSCRTQLAGTGGSNAQPYPGSMSEDGRTVFFTADGPGASATPCMGTGENAAREVSVDEVFARVDGELRPGEGHSLSLAEAHTVAISEPAVSECGAGAGAGEAACRKAAVEPANAEFVGASAGGSEAFFLSPQQLTNEASEDPNKNAATLEPGQEHLCHLSGEAGGCNLYSFDLGAPEGKELVDVSRGDVSGKGPRVQGVMALSPDGSHVYFVAKGVLTSAPNERSQVARNGAENLYLFERDSAFPNGRTVFITDLLPTVEPQGDEREWEQQPGEPVNVSPDGRFLVFLSRGDLTADDTSVSGASQVFRYDAGTGQLIRVSVGNAGFDDNGDRSAPGVCVIGVGCEEDAGIVLGAKGERPDPSMSDDGSRVFFESPVGLTSGALDDVRAGEVNGRAVLAQNLYEWEQEGVGSCPAGRAAGCVFLISDGRDVFKNESNYGAVCHQRVALCLLGTDSSGRDVFFATADSLVSADTNTEVDFYDARVCEPGGCVPEASLVASSGCGGEEECRGAPTVQVGLPSGGSLTVAASSVVAGSVGAGVKPGATLVKKCRKGFARKHGKGKCVRVRHASRSAAKKHAKRATHHETSVRGPGRAR
jgi:hypothetical protein